MRKSIVANKYKEVARCLQQECYSRFEDTQKCVATNNLLPLASEVMLKQFYQNFNCR
jgi:hypothetical protein